MTDPELVSLLRWALPQLGLRFEGFRRVRGIVRKRIARRMRVLDVTDYRAWLETHDDEWIVLARMCRIPISRFYRDRMIFERIGALLSERAARKPDRVRIWSAGCASGEEPYTLAMIWSADVAPLHPGIDLQIVATDVEETMIERAIAGRYEAGSLRELPVRLRKACFDGDRVIDEIRRSIAFRGEDMREVVPEGPFDLVLCRNSAFTYFDEATQRRLLETIVARLWPGGALVVGAHETPPAHPALSRLGSSLWAMGNSEIS